MHETEGVVRPFGYVDPEPVVRRIGDRDLYLGNRHAADPDAHDRRFAHVLSVCAEALPLTTHHRPLRDGPGNAWTAFEGAVDTARDLSRREGALLVNCRAGVSRSSAVVATALAAEETRSLGDALDTVLDARPAAMPHPALHRLGVVYLAADPRHSTETVRDSV